MVIKRARSKTKILLIAALVVVFGLGGFVSLHSLSTNDRPVSSNADNKTTRDDVMSEISDAEEKALAEAMSLPPVPALTPETLSAQQNIPAPAANNYRPACLNLKASYTADYEKNVQAEKQRNWSSQQSIMNKYSSEGLSFSRSQKYALQKEASRHASVNDQLKKNYEKQLKTLGC